MREQACQWALTHSEHTRGGGALELQDLRLLEDGSERGHALNSDAVATKTASEGRSEDGERAAVSRGADIKANTLELVREVGGLLERLQHRVALEALCNRGSSFRTELVVIETAGVGSEVGGEPCQGALTQKQTLQYGNRGAPQVSDLRLLEDGSDCGGAPVSKEVVTETASEGQNGKQR